MTHRDSILIGRAAALVAAMFAGPAGAAGNDRTLSLGEAVRMAGAGAPRTRLAAHAEAIAAAGADERRGALLPRLTGSASQANRTMNPSAQGLEIPGQAGVIGPFDSFDARLGVAQPLLDWSAWSRWRESLSGRDAARADRERAAEDAAVAAARAAVRLATADASVAAREADLTLAVELHALSLTRRDAGTTADIDVTRASAQVAEARSALASARHRRVLAEVALRRALGLDPAGAVTLADTLGAELARVAPVPTREAAVAVALERRPDLAAARLHERSARHGLNAARAEWIPRLELTADAGWSGADPGDAEETRQVAVQLRWPIVDGLAREARVARGRAAAAAAGVEVTETADAAAADVVAAWSALETGRMLEAVAAERDRLAAEEVAQARLRLEEGVSGNLDVIEAQATRVRARDAVIEARAHSALARIDLAHAMGVAREIH